MMIRQGDLIYIDALDRQGRDHCRVEVYITRDLGADIVCLDNESYLQLYRFLFDDRNDP